MSDIKNIEQLPEFIRMHVSNFASKFVTLHGSNIISMAVYGSAVSGNFIPKVSDVNIVMILKELHFKDLKMSLHLVKEAKGNKINAPLFLTEDYIRRSLDVFPVEFLDLKENHLTIYGVDLLSVFQVDTKHLKLFCEEQIKGKLLRVRQAYLEIGLNPKGQEALLKDSLKALIPIFRNLLRLRAKAVPLSNEDILKSLSQEFNVDSTVLIAIWCDHANDDKIAGQAVEMYLEKYINILEQLSVKVDE